MKKLAVIKLGSRIAISSSGTSGGTGETLSVIEILKTAGYEIDAYTKILSKDDPPNGFNIYNIEDTYLDINDKDYDALIVLNGNVNYFGGQDDRAQTLNYHIINNFNGKVFYILCDCNLLLRQIWPSVAKKEWSHLYNQSDIEIVRDDIIYISQPREVEKTLESARKHVNIKDCIHFPFEKFPLLTSNPLEYNENPKYDLLYGGTFRSGRREDDMVKFYFGYPESLKVTLFGKIQEKNFKADKISGLRSPDYEKAVPYDEFLNKMRESKATVIIGDKLYKKLDDLAQRIYESINAMNVVLLDASYDKNKRVFKHPELVEFNYVNTRDDVIDRLNRLQNDEFRKHIVDLQLNDVDFDKIDYSNTLKNIIEEHLK